MFNIFSSTVGRKSPVASHRPVIFIDSNVLSVENEHIPLPILLLITINLIMYHKLIEICSLSTPNILEVMKIPRGM